MQCARLVSWRPRPTPSRRRRTPSRIANPPLSFPWPPHHLRIPSQIANPPLFLPLPFRRRRIPSQLATLPLPVVASPSPLDKSVLVPARSWKEVCTAPTRLSLDLSIFDGKVTQVTLSFGEGPARTPNITFDDSMIGAPSQAWERTLIFRSIGARFSVDCVAYRIRDAMQIKGKYSLCDLSNGFFFIKLDDLEDCDSILTEGPWSVYGHYLAVKRWTADFDPISDSITTTPVWIRVRNLPVLFYKETTLTHIAVGIGEPVKVDARTLGTERGRYAKFCVQLDLSAPLPSSIIVQGSEYKIEYEHLQTLYGCCGLFGHCTHQCPKNTNQSGARKAESTTKAHHVSSSGAAGDQWKVKQGKKWVPKPVEGDQNVSEKPDYG